MMIFGIIVFVFCLWAVFSKHFCDGIVAKHLLSFSAMMGVLTALDPKNMDAALATLVLLIAGLAYWFIKHWHIINKRLDELFR